MRIGDGTQPTGSVMNLSHTDVQQREMRYAYYDGAPGVMVSGLVWVVATVVCWQMGVEQGVWTLLIGGVLIYPMGVLATKALGRPGTTDTSNALNPLAMASTIWLLLCCAMAYGLFLLKPALFFPAMLGTIGSRYLVFASVYGRAAYWVLGATLLAAAFLAFFLALAPTIAAGMGGLIEVLFAFLVFSKAAKTAV